MTAPTRLSTRRSLRQRVTTRTLVIAALALIAGEAVTFGLYRQRLGQQLDETLSARVALTATLAQDHQGADLITRLERTGIRATIVAPDGTVSRSTPSLPRVAQNLPAPGADPDPTQHVAQRIELPDGSDATVFVLRTGVDHSLRTLLVVEAAVTAVALAGIAVAARHAARRSLEPIDTVIDYAATVSAGDRERRLEPDDPTTEIGRLAQAIDTMVHDLRAAEDELRHQIDASHRLTADAAHQLRTPFAGIRATIDLLASHPDHPRNDELLQAASRECHRAARLIDHLLTLARLDQHHPAEPRTIDLVALVDHELGRTRTLRPDLRVDADLPGTVPVVAAPADLADAFANLLDNARQNADTCIDITIQTTATTAHVRVRDDGPEMESEQARRAFDRFHTTRPGGTGLGLPIAQAIIAAHDGTLRYDDGAIHIDLPLADGS